MTEEHLDKTHLQTNNTLMCNNCFLVVVSLKRGKLLKVQKRHMQEVNQGHIYCKKYVQECPAGDEPWGL